MFEEKAMTTSATLSTVDAAHPPSHEASADHRVQQYHADGFLVVRGVFSREEVARMDSEAARLMGRTELMDTNNIRCRWQDDVTTGECRFDCFDPVIDLSPLFAGVARDPRLLSAVSALYGEPAHLFKDKLIFKPPNAKGYRLHQDYIGWTSFPRSFATVIVAIDPSDRDSGGTEVFRGYHRQGSLIPADGNYHDLPEDAVDLSTGVVLELNPGDIAIFSGYTPHRSAPNRSTHWRRLLYLSYNAASDGGEQREAHYVEFARWLQEKYAEYGRTNTFFR
jgi:ectoine hydroxylase-related dioxygenase (phytanoyl-CoA dioxygenase family)